MTTTRRLLWLMAGVLLGGIGVGMFFQPNREARAANDRFEDYILCTGAVAIAPRQPTDGVWLLDYRAGKLLGTLIDRTQNGKVNGFAEVDLVSEFGLPPRANVHFLMTTGMVTNGQAVLYVAETTSGKFAVYSMGLRMDGLPGVQIHRHDLVPFRQPKN